jgi:hypothetical protein
MPSEHDLCQKTNRFFFIVSNPTGAMAWIHHVFARVMRAICHVGDGRSVCQIGTHDSDCGNCNRIGDRIAFTNGWWRHHGLPRMIVSYQGPSFTT